MLFTHSHHQNSNKCTITFNFYTTYILFSLFLWKIPENGPRPSTPLDIDTLGYLLLDYTSNMLGQALLTSYTIFQTLLHHCALGPINPCYTPKPFSEPLQFVKQPHL